MQNLGCHFALTEVRSEARVVLEVLDEGLEYGLEAQHGPNWGLKRSLILFKEEGALGVSFALQVGLKPLGIGELSIAFGAKPLRHPGGEGP